MKNNPIIPIILCGGTGSRLWPLSRECFPKQYLPLIENDSKSMVQITYKRLEGLKNLSEPIIICNEEHRFIVAEQFREINIKPRSILLEPFGKNTAPAIAIAALKALEIEKDPTLLIVSSDHQIINSKHFKEVLKEGLNFSNSDKLVIFGVLPNSPETGYGYIKIDSKIDRNKVRGYEVDEFIEKPSCEVAQKFIQSNKYLWNSGIFLFKAKKIISELEKFSPEILKYCRKSIENNLNDLDFQRIDKNYFKKCQSISIDIAVMEKTKIGKVLPLNVGWSDLGNWNSIWQNSKKDADGNSIKGRVLVKDSKNCYVRSEERLIVALGIKNIVAVETSDALLIVEKNKTQNIKEIVNELKEKNFLEGIEHKKIYRPWGSYTSIAESYNWKVKKIIVKPDEALSLQMHNFRSEHWVVVDGEAKVEVDNTSIKLKKNESVYIPEKTKHKLSNEGKKDLTLIEVQSGSYLGEDDIIRFEDRYGRISN